MTKNNRKIASLLVAYSMFCGGELPLVNTKKSGLDLPTKGVKGLSNAELKPHKSGKNKRKRRKK